MDTIVEISKMFRKKKYFELNDYELKKVEGPL
jgi:hypothetical protein